MYQTQFRKPLFDHDFADDWTLIPFTPQYSSSSYLPSSSTNSSTEPKRLAPTMQSFSSSTDSHCHVGDNSVTSRLKDSNDAKVGLQLTAPRGRNSDIPPFARSTNWWRLSNTSDRQDTQNTRRVQERTTDLSMRGSHVRDSVSRTSPSENSPLQGSKVMPKDFNRPLTCFYWATQGHCNKSDRECWYAHHWTGVIAAAPVRLGQGGAVAGKIAERMVEEATTRTLSREEQEAVMTAREYDIDRKAEAIDHGVAELKHNTDRILNEIDSINVANEVACCTLEQCREHILSSLEMHATDGSGSLFDADGKLQTQARMLATIDKAIDAMTMMRTRLDEVAKHTHIDAVNPGMLANGIKIEKVRARNGFAN